MRRTYYHVAAALITLALVSVLAISAHKLIQADDERGDLERAVIRSCEILNSKIAESQKPPAPNSSTAQLIDMILDGGTPAARAEFARRVEAEKEGGQRLAPADCEAEARKALDR